MARTDVHSPNNLVTEDYEYFGSYDAGGADSGPEAAKARIAFFERIALLGLRFDNEHGNGYGCYHCGANIRYVAVLKHLPTGKLIKVGETCLDNRFERSTEDFKALKKNAELDRAAQRIKTAREEYFAANPEVRETYDAFKAWRKDGTDPLGLFTDHFLNDLLHRLETNGTLSEKQTPWIAKCIERNAKFAALQAERAAERATVPALAEGTYQFTGQVLSVKEQENDYGTQYKLTLKNELGQVAWGTLPSYIRWDFEREDWLKLTITIKASFTPSEKDPGFAFYKRPRVIKVEGAEPVVTCPGHESTEGPAGISTYCDGSCRR